MTNTPGIRVNSDAPEIPAKLFTIIGFLVFVEFASGFIQGFYDPLQKVFAISHGVSDAQITWFHTVQGLSAAICVPVLAKLGDMFGHRRILRITVALVLVGTVLTALAPNFEILLLARIIMGPIAVWLPLEVALVHAQVSGESARRSIGVLISVLTIGVIIGNILAGVIVGKMPFSIALLVPGLFVLGALYAVMFRIPESTARSSPKLDGLGIAGLALGMILLLLGMSLFAENGISSMTGWLLIGSAVAVLAAWVFWERQTTDPAVDVKMLSSPERAPLYIGGFLFGFVLFGFQTPLTTFAASIPGRDGYGLGLSTLAVSLVIAFFTILTAVGAASFTFLSHKIGMRKLMVAGSLLAAAGFGLFAVFHTGVWTVFTLAVPAGLGMGLLLGALPALIAENAPANSTGVAVGIYNSLRTLGGSIAGASFAIVLSATALPNGHASNSGYAIIWAIAACVFIIAAVVLAFGRYPSEVFEAKRPTPTGTMPVIDQSPSEAAPYGRNTP